MMARVGEHCQRIARECIAMRVRLLNRVITNIYDECMRPHGLRTAQMNILVAVSLKGLVTPSDIERHLYLDKSTVSRNVDRMRRRGWLEAVPGKDGRSHHLHVTAQGAKLLQKALSAWERAQEKAASLLGKQGVDALVRIGADVRAQKS